MLGPGVSRKEEKLFMVRGGSMYVSGVAMGSLLAQGDWVRECSGVSLAGHRSADR